MERGPVAAHAEGAGHRLGRPPGPGAGRALRRRRPAGRRDGPGGLRFTQEILLWDGASRIEFRTHADGSIGSDRLLRVRFPAAVPGALPVYQSALSVLGRPFGSTDTDVAEHWYTLDNPAHEWFGLSSAARVSLTAPSGERLTRAIGVAEVVCPARPDAARAAIRDLLVALAGQGVTATCARPDGPRYGSIDLDSNLPDVRIALGGPEQNPFTAEVLAAAGPEAGRELAAQLSARGWARLWVPAAISREQAFRPGADLRGARDLPVLIVAGGDLAAAIAAVTADLADAVIEAGPAPAGAASGGAASDRAGGEAGPAVPDLAGYSVALLNRGTPSSLVTPDGTLNIALMRSCSGWPCGVWIEGDARTAPDGTSFAWQHWSHTFEYALAAGPGDWRTAGFPLAGLDYNRDLLAVQTGLHDGPLPASASLLSVEPATAVLSALKPHGNPLASGRPGAPERGDGVTLRLRDVSGQPGPARRAGAHRGRPGRGQPDRPGRGSGRRPAAAAGRGGRRGGTGGGRGDPGPGHAALAGRAAGRGWRGRGGGGGHAGAGPARLYPLLAARQGTGAGREPAGGRAPVRRARRRGRGPGGRRGGPGGQDRACRARRRDRRAAADRGLRPGAGGRLGRAGPARPAGGRPGRPAALRPGAARARQLGAAGAGPAGHRGRTVLPRGPDQGPGRPAA